VDSIVAGEGSTIVVTPDVGRLGALVRFLRRAGRPVVEYHGLLDGATRAAAWAAARAGGCVIVGGRLAAWAPAPDLAAAVVLDEGDEALADERAPTWDATDVLAERTGRSGAPQHLVAAVPTLRAVTAAGGAVRRLPPGEERAGWPALEVVDLRATDPAEGLMTARLAAALAAVLEAGNRAVCLLNRAGGARLLACARCGAVARCAACGAALAEEPDTPGRLTCPRCGAGTPAFCTRCAHTRLRRRRPGARRAAAAVAALVPRHRVAAVEGRPGGPVPADAEVLVGTEAVLHRVPPGPPVGLVAHLDADVDLLAPRAYAAEQAARLLVRSARLVGTRGRILVQTRVPDHPVVEAFRHRDPMVVADSEAPARRTLGLPPFGAVAEVSGAPEPLAVALGALRAAGTAVDGPIPAGGREVALVRSRDPDRLADALADAVAAARPHGGVRVAVDPKRI
jgi:primosomal protein N' (replication factor Y)